MMIRFLILAIALVFISCKEEIQIRDFPFDSEDINYFNEIVFFSEVDKMEKNSFIKWDEDLLIQVEGNTSGKNLNFINEAIAEINAIGLPITLKSTSENSNVSLFIGSKKEYFIKTGRKLSKGVLGNFTINYSKLFFKKGKINSASIFIADSLPGKRKKGIILEEIIQSLGLTGDSGTLSKSLFYELDKTLPYIPDIDKTMLKMLYHPSIKAGMSREGFREFFRDSLVDWDTEQKIIKYCKANQISPSVLDTIAKRSAVNGNVHLFQNDRICISSSNPALFSKKFQEEVHELNKISPNINLQFCNDEKYQGVYFDMIDSVGLKKYRNNYSVYHRTNILNPRRYYAPVKVKIDLCQTPQTKLDSILKSSLIKAISIYDHHDLITEQKFPDYKKMLQLYYSNVIPSNFPAKSLKEISKKYKEIVR